LAPIFLLELTYSDLTNLTRVTDQAFGYNLTPGCKKIGPTFMGSTNIRSTSLRVDEFSLYL
jgi:hypothetical protein